MTASPLAWSLTWPRTAPVVESCAWAVPIAVSRPATARIEALFVSLMAVSPWVCRLRVRHDHAGLERDGVGVRDLAGQRIEQDELAAGDVGDGVTLGGHDRDDVDRLLVE